METSDAALLNHSSTPAKEPSKDVPFLRRKRYLVAIMVFFGMVLVCFLRMNLAIVIVDMTTERKIENGNQSYLKEPEFKWTPFEIGLLLGCPSVLGVFAFFGGLLSCRYGGVRVFGLALFFNGVLTCLTPIVVRLGVLVFSILRMIEGLCCAITFVSLLQIFVRWSPVTEKFRMIDYATTGFLLGVITVFPLCGLILENWSWSYVFFISGGATMVWYIIWILFIYNDPLDDKFIMPEEQRFLNENVEVITNKTKVYPWLKILSSKAVWAYLNERFVEAWSFSLSTDCLPIYINDAFNVSISQIGLLSSAPNLCNLLGMLIGAQIADFLFNRSAISNSKIYIGIITLCHIFCIILLMIMGLRADYIVSMFCMCILRFVFGVAGSVYSVLPLDIAGEYASLVCGFGASIFNIGLVLNPIIMAYVVPNHNLSDWSRYFLLLSAFNVWGAIIFFFNGSGQPEPWSTARKKINPKY